MLQKIVFFLLVPFFVNATVVVETSHKRYDVILWISENIFLFDLIVFLFFSVVTLGIYILSVKKKLENKKRELEDSMELLEQQESALNEHSIVSITDTRGKITYVNDKFVEISGYTREELLGNNHRLLNSGQHDSTFWKNMYATVSRGDVWKNPAICNVRKDSSVYWVNTVIVPFKKHGEIESYVAIRTDISESVAIENELEQLFEESQEIMKEKEVLNEKLEKLAYYDALTGIPNRLNIMETLARVLATAKRNSLYMSVMFIDLDGFKLINDTLSHDAGDKVLKDVAEVFKSTLRIDDFYGRLGGDEFFVVILGTDKKENIAVLCEKLLRNIGTIELPAPVNESFGASIGVVKTLPDATVDVEMLLRESDNVMYGVKKEGKNSYTIKDL